jgi:hypothetical protein
MRAECYATERSAPLHKAGHANMLQRGAGTGLTQACAFPPLFCKHSAVYRDGKKCISLITITVAVILWCVREP